MLGLNGAQAIPWAVQSVPLEVNFDVLVKTEIDFDVDVV